MAGGVDRIGGNGSRPVPSQGRRRSHESVAGFTLLEVVVALAVLGILFVSLTQGSRFIVFAWDRHVRLVDQNTDLDAVDRILRSIIERARPGSKWEPLEFVGTAHAIAFTTMLPTPVGEFPSRRADVELSVDASHHLVLLWTPHMHVLRIGRPAPASTTEILQGVERLELSYLPTQGGKWTQVWHNSAPPCLVRIRIVFSDSGHPRWPDILAGPMLSAP